MLIVLGGLPGVGKTTIAQAFARAAFAVHVRIDSIEGAIRGYRAAYAVAEDNLRVGHIVVADSVNPVPITRAAWLDVARRAGTPAIEVEIRCSDGAEHRRGSKAVWLSNREAGRPGRRFCVVITVPGRPQRMWSTPQR